ncbi:hypothetical protein D3C81_906530 [compost metagenome]
MGQLLDVESLLITTMDLADRTGHFAEMSLSVERGAHGATLLTGQDAVIDFPQQGRPEDLRFAGNAHRFQKTQGGCPQ